MRYSEIRTECDRWQGVARSISRKWLIDEHRMLRLEIDDIGVPRLQLATKAPGGEMPAITLPEHVALRERDDPRAAFFLRHNATDFTADQLERIARYIRTVKDWEAGLLDELPPSTT